MMCVQEQRELHPLSQLDQIALTKVQGLLEARLDQALVNQEVQEVLLRGQVLQEEITVRQGAVHLRPTTAYLQEEILAAERPCQVHQGAAHHQVEDHQAEEDEIKAIHFPSLSRPRSSAYFRPKRI